MKRVSPRFRSNLLGLLGPLGFAILCLAARFTTSWLALGGLVWILWAEYTSLRIRCPSCGTAVRSGGFTVLGLRFTGARPLAPKYCKGCGWDLSRTDNAAGGERG